MEVSEEDPSKTCCVCCRGSQRVERGLYVFQTHNDVFNADVNGAEDIHLDLNQSNSESAPEYGGYSGLLAQPDVYLYDFSRGFQPRDEVID